MTNKMREKSMWKRKDCFVAQSIVLRSTQVRWVFLLHVFRNLATYRLSEKHLTLSLWYKVVSCFSNKIERLTNYVGSANAPFSVRSFRRYTKYLPLLSIYVFFHQVVHLNLLYTDTIKENTFHTLDVRICNHIALSYVVYLSSSFV